MIKRILLILLLIISFGEAKMNMFQSVSPSEATIVQTGKGKMFCPGCGMYLPKFWKTSHAIKFKDGTYKQFCSIHCLVEDLEFKYLKDKKNNIQEILVTDVTSLKYIDASKAFYVISSKKKGTMSMNSKYAFKYKKDAQKFQAKNGGYIVDFDTAYNSALIDFAKDIGFIFAKRSSKMYKKGKMIYNHKCDKNGLETIHTHTIASLKGLIKDKKICGDLNPKQLQAVSLYFWDIKLNKFNKLYGKKYKFENKKYSKKEIKDYKKGERIYKRVCQEIDVTQYNSLNDLKKLCRNLNDKRLELVSKYLWDKKRVNKNIIKTTSIKVSKDEKCPVCGMFIYKYPRWAAQIFYKDKDSKHHLSFDGVKDMMKFYFNPSLWGKYNKSLINNILKISVTDYYSQNRINGKEAYYVIGSNVYGPMGNELIPFKNIEDAKIFKKDHFGTKIIKFDKIKEKEVYSLDE